VEKPTDGRSGLRLPAACIVLVLAIALAGALGGSIAHGRQGLIGSAAVAVAALTCGLSGLAALALAGVLSGTRWGVHGILAAGFVRFFLPLAVVTASAAVQGPLSRAGLFGYMVIFFLIALVVETLLLVGVLQSANQTNVAWRGR
jgi:hypothetical protein